MNGTRAATTSAYQPGIAGLVVFSAPADGFPARLVAFNATSTLPPGLFLDLFARLLRVNFF
ncbi:unknown protein [Cronobacter turicensis z3032]|uniref:Uncharacterized protein n=1 Tax=Cronobacter turicensis (strain DSM 18703 / CCUG 55852 / LMG 23827 / z3032) TaxID=693216 RepID=C9XUM0_CROTZ|nr:unknown protein [Cronobacter turicensis z3032]